MTCFEKNQFFATCKQSCRAGSNQQDSDWLPWSCKALGPMTPVKASWVDSVCAHGVEDCIKKNCCAGPGLQCYKQTDFYGQCMHDCKKGKDPAQPFAPAWTCEPVGLRTPMDAPHAVSERTDGIVSSWVPDHCSYDGQNCVHSQCCVALDMQCWQLNQTFATCMDTCQVGQAL